MSDKIATASAELQNIRTELEEVHGEPVSETNEMVVFRDEHGHELGDIAHEIEGISRAEVAEWMHEQARGVYGRDEATGNGDPWSVSDPVVVLKDD